MGLFIISKKLRQTLWVWQTLWILRFDISEVRDPECGRQEIQESGGKSESDFQYGRRGDQESGNWVWFNVVVTRTETSNVYRITPWSVVLTSSDKGII